MLDNTSLNLKFDGQDAIRSDVLDTFSYTGEEQEITYKTREFSAVCPFSGLPDIATVTLDYIPHSRCLELKSLKLYFVSYRNVGIYQEDATNRIFRDIWNVLEPRMLRVQTVYATRGGIDSTCAIQKKQE
jgi:7-cyano-7-deazaguanine reductase